MASQSWINKDFYAALGVSKGATADEIKKSYRKLALQHHPDRNPGNKQSEEKFKDMAEAYDVLSDPKKRAEYDQLRDAVAAGGGRGWPGGFRTDDLGDEFDLQDFLQTVMGGSGGGFGGFGRRGRRKGSDVETTVTLSFEEAALGSERRVSLDLPTTCSACGGSGGKNPKTCPQCSGRGTVANSKGPFAISQSCPGCRGRGTVSDDPCQGCGGSGTRKERREFTVKFPAGVSDGARIRVRGRGEAGSSGGGSGDLFVRVSVAAHPFFSRRGDDLTITLPLTFAEAALGAQVKVPTLSEPVTLKVPPGTSSGKTFRIRGRGIPRRAGAGDLLATVQIAVPQKLSKAERDAVEKLAASEESPRSHLGV
ncbi:MAG TPA: molecular chaperone DnaJ [Actinomycetota bacterium]|nr:molecular chaperone DnaJ [Actinomycetota bacterium]